MSDHPLITTLHERARSLGGRIVLPESHDPRVLQAASLAAHRRLARPILLGDRAAVEALASRLGFALDGVEVVDHLAEGAVAPYAIALVELLESRGKSIEPRTAAKLLVDPLYFATMMVVAGDAEGMVAGADHATPRVLRPVFYLVDRSDGMRTVSSAFLIILPDSSFGQSGVLVFSDPAVVPNPTVEELVEIAVASGETCRRLVGVEPRIALLSFSTHGSSTHPSARKMALATERIRELHPELLVDGELQLDAALMPELARRKAPDSVLRGQANVLVFPDLGTANIVVKVTERLARAQAYGSFLQGLARPISDLSRGAGVRDIVNVIAATCLQGQPAPTASRERRSLPFAPGTREPALPTSAPGTGGRSGIQLQDPQSAVAVSSRSGPQVG